MATESKPGLIVRKGNVIVATIPEGVTQRYAVRTGDLRKGTNTTSARYDMKLGEYFMDATVSPTTRGVQVTDGSVVIAQFSYDRLGEKALEVVETIKTTDGHYVQELRKLHTDPDRFRREIRAILGPQAKAEEVESTLLRLHPWKTS